MKHIMFRSFPLALILTAPLAALPVSLERTGEQIGGKTSSDTGGSGVLTYTSAKVRASFSRDASVTRSGEPSYHIVNRGRPDGRPGIDEDAAYIFPCEALPGLTYSISGYIKTKEVRYAGFRVTIKGPRGWGSGDVKCDEVRGTNDWTKITASFTAPAKATPFNVILRVRFAGEAWFDQIVVRDNLEDVISRNAGRTAEQLAKIQADAEDLDTLAPEDRNAIADAAQVSRVLLDRGRSLKPTDEIPQATRRDLAETCARLERLVLRFGRLVDLHRYVAAVRERTGREPPLLIGFAPPTVHVFLEDLPVDIDPVDRKTILAVRGETEAVQLVIAPHKEDLEQVRVSASDLIGTPGTIASSSVIIKPVGFVRIEAQERFYDPEQQRESDYLGWWPDPLLDNFAFDVKKNSFQPVWIEVHVDRSVAAGHYDGTLTITGAGGLRQTVGLGVHVSEVALPQTLSFKNIMSWYEPWGTRMYEQTDPKGDEVIKYGRQWSLELRKAFLDFLADRRINLTSIYGTPEDPFSMQEIRDAAARGQNVILPLVLKREVGVQTTPPYLTTWDGGEGTQQMMQRVLDKWSAFLKKEGLYDRAIVYGFDEQGAEWYPCIKHVADFVGERYGLPLLMAGVDEHSYGTATILGEATNIIYCPMMKKYDVEAATKARKRGTRMWWYDICWSIEQPLIRSRLIPWQSFKVGAEGFLIWNLNHWRGNSKPLGADKTRTDWNPWLIGVAPNSSALYVYPGVNGPVSSLRLENFRDGTEDYELLLMAYDILAVMEKDGSADESIAADLRDAITIADPFIEDDVRYSTDPRLLANRRQRLILALEAVPADVAAKARPRDIRPIDAPVPMPQTGSQVDAGRTLLCDVPEFWKFRTDPKNIGEKQKWFAADTNRDDWSRASTHRFWDSFVKNPPYEGDGWYAVDVEIPAASGKEVWLILGAVDENYTLWINGEYVADNLEVGLDVWDKPAVIPIAGRFKAGKSNHIVVRVRNTLRAGGIWKPSRVVAEK